MLFFYLTVLVLSSQSVSGTFQPQLNQVFYSLLSRGLGSALRHPAGMSPA